MAKHRWYRYPLYLLVRTGAGLLGLLPRRALIALALALGHLGFYLVGRQREKTLAQLRRVYGGVKPEPEIRKMAQAVFRHFSMFAAEVLQFPKLDGGKVLKFVEARKALAVYNQLLAEGKGVIFITAHLGNWELLGAVSCLNGIPGCVVGRRIYYEPYNRWIENLRHSVRVHTIYRESAAREVLKRLRANQVVGILPDQDIDSLDGIFVDYFGRPAYTSVAPVKIAMATGAPILPGFVVRTGGDRYEFVLGDVLRPFKERDGGEAAVRKYTEAWMRQFETMIRRYPEQWGWMHDRWKTRPPGERADREPLFSKPMAGNR